MEVIILLLTLLFGLFFGVESSANMPVAAPPVVDVVPAAPADAQAVEPQMRVLAVVEAVDVLQLESFPVQIQLHVTGYHQDGCEAPTEVVQSRDGNIVTVELYRVLPAAVMCPMVLQPLDETIMLDGGFEPGTYVINVNGVVTEVTI